MQRARRVARGPCLHCLKGGLRLYVTGLGIGPLPLGLGRLIMYSKVKRVGALWAAAALG